MEYFKPFNGTVVTNAQFAPLAILQKVSKSYMNYIPPAIVKEIIVTCSYDGQVKVFYHLIELK